MHGYRLIILLIVTFNNYNSLHLCVLKNVCKIFTQKKNVCARSCTTAFAAPLVQLFNYIIHGRRSCASLVSGKQLSSIRYHQRSQRLHKLQTTGRYQSRRFFDVSRKVHYAKVHLPCFAAAVSGTVLDTAVCKAGHELLHNVPFERHRKDRRDWYRPVVCNLCRLWDLWWYRIDDSCFPLTRHNSFCHWHCAWQCRMPWWSRMRRHDQWTTWCVRCEAKLWMWRLLHQSAKKQIGHQNTVLVELCRRTLINIQLRPTSAYFIYFYSFILFFIFLFLW